MSETSALVGIGICTYCRPALLKAALLSLDKIEIPNGLIIKILVVDNDPLKSAKQTVLSLSIRHTVSYQMVPGGRIMARNAVLDTFIRHNTHYIALCDDDAQVSTQWLVTLYEHLQLYQADVITDYIRVHLPRHASRWISTNYEEFTVRLGDPLYLTK